MHGTTVLPRKTPTPQKNGMNSRVKFDDGLNVSEGRANEKRREWIQQLIEKLRAKEQREKKHTKSTDSQWKETPGKTPVREYLISLISHSSLSEPSKGFNSGYTEEKSREDWFDCEDSQFEGSSQSIERSHSRKDCYHIERSTSIEGARLRDD